jgi:hypothetical protein
MTLWGFTPTRQYNNAAYNNDSSGDGPDPDRLIRRITMPLPRYGHPYVSYAPVVDGAGAGDRDDGTETWGACLGVLVCIMLLLLLAFTASYPISYYYYPADQNGNVYRGSYSYNHGCPGCWR